MMEVFNSLTTNQLLPPSPAICPTALFNHQTITPGPKSPPKPANPALDNILMFVNERLISRLFDTSALQQALPWREELTVESILSAIEDSHQEIQVKKHRKVAEMLNSKLIVVSNPEKYKVLCEFGIPLYDTKITALLRDLHTLNNDLPSDCDIFIIPSWNNRERNVLAITRSESLERFEANDRESMLIESLLLAVIPIPNNKTSAERVEGETGISNEEDTAMWIIKAIGRRQPEAFVSAAHKLGFPMSVENILWKYVCTSYYGGYLRVENSGARNVCAGHGPVILMKS